MIITYLELAGWGGGPGFAHSKTFEGRFRAQQQANGLMKFTALEAGTWGWRDQNKTVPAGQVIYCHPRHIYQMNEEEEPPEVTQRRRVTKHFHAAPKEKEHV